MEAGEGKAQKEEELLGLAQSLRVKRGYRNQSWASTPQPCLGFLCSCCSACSFGIFAITLAGVLIGVHANLHSEKVEYACHTRSCACNTSAPTCSVTFHVRKALRPPLVLQYELDNFYQAHYRFIRAEDERLQLLRDSAYNDSLELLTSSGRRVDLDTTAQFGTSKYNGQRPGDSPLLAAFLTPSAYRHLRKPYARVREALPVGNYTMLIGNHYPTSTFLGSKSFVLTSFDSTLGGNQPTLYLFCFVFGAISMILGALVMLLAICPLPIDFKCDKLENQHRLYLANEEMRIAAEQKEAEDDEKQTSLLNSDVQKGLELIQRYAAPEAKEHGTANLVAAALKMKQQEAPVPRSQQRRQSQTLLLKAENKYKRCV